MFQSCISDASKSSIADPIAGAYLVTYSSNHFLGNTYLYLKSLGGDQVEITPHMQTDCPSFTATIVKLSNGYGFIIKSQSTSSGTIDPQLVGSTNYSGAFDNSSNSLALTFTLTTSSGVDQIALLSAAKDSSPYPCFNRQKDNGETGTDCGGNCSYKCVDASTALTVLKNASNEQFWSMNFYDANIGMAYSNSTVKSTLYKTTDGGKTWAASSSPTTSIVRQIRFVTSTVIYINADDGLYFSNTGGSQWAKSSAVPAPQLGGGLFYQIDNQNWVIGPDYDHMAYTSNAGTSWTSVKINSANSTTNSLYPSNIIQFVSATTGYSVFRDGSNGKIYLFKSVDAGHSWNYVSQPVAKYVEDFHFTDEMNGFMVGDFNEVLKTTDGGITWTVAATLTSFNTGVYINGTKGIVVGNQIYYTVDSGANWNVLEGVTVGPFVALQVLNQLNAFAVAQNGVVRIDLTAIN